jgi:YVTN family beta-propeller protein
VRGRHWIVAGTAAVAIAACGITTAMAAGAVPGNPFGSNVVGATQHSGRILLPDNQWISPYGQRAATFSAESIGTAVSPDGTKIASQTGADNIGTPQLSILNATTGAVLQSFGGTGVAAPVYSPNGSTLYAATLTGILKYSVGADGLVTDPTGPETIGLGSGTFPYSMAISADGKTLYAAESGVNKLAIIDTATDSVTGQVAVGNAPAGIAVVGNKVFVSNRGGRPAVAGDTTNTSDGTKIVSDPVTGASTTGTVSVVDPTVKNPITVPTAPDTSAVKPDIIDIDFADGTPAEHAQNLPATTYGAPSITNDPTVGKNVATFNGTTDAYTYPFQDQWSKVSKSFTIDCKFRWNGAAPSTAGKGVCEDLNGGGIGVDILNGEAMTYAHIGGAYKEIFDPTPVVPGTWYDVVTTWDGANLNEYVNGKRVATMPASGALGKPSPSTSWHWTLGANAAPTPAGFEAPARVSIASSKVWSTALPPGPSQTTYTFGALKDTINVGLQPAALTVHDGAVFAANTNSDTVSIIDAASHKVTQTVNVEPLHGAKVGASPNSVTFTDDHHMLVSVGGDNAIAMFDYNGERTPVGYKGLIPTDWYPNQVSFDAKAKKVIVSNQQGIGTNGYPQSHKYQGTLTSFTMPKDSALHTTTQTVFNDNAWNTPKPKGSGNRPHGQAPAIPNQLGQPSAIKHVFLIIKENRTYDQLLGDLGKGNGDPADTSYGATVTPNQHSLASTYTDFDNFYDSGMLSADGHQWLVQGDNNDYQAQNAASTWARSYPYPGGDALSYQRDGFIRNTVENAGGTVRNYGEFEAATTGKQGTWQQYYADSQIMEGKATGPLPVAQNAAQWVSDVPSLNQVSNHDYPHFDPSIPDQYRADIWEQDFKNAEKTGVLPSLTTMTLGDDHTGGAPTGEAQNADNDLAVGRIVSDISHSQFWKDSAVFVLEDDTQAGSDHVDGHRGPLFIASPYAKRGVVNSGYYTQVNVVKTIEQILGAQPMNQMDQAAVPMYDAFTNTPNLTPYTLQPNQVPLTQGVTNLIPLTPSASTAADPSAAAAVTATNGPAAPAVPAAEKSVAGQWATWYKTEAEPKLTGPNAVADATNPAQMNRYDWYTSTDWAKPYPGDKHILPPTKVPGRNLPSDFLGD